MSRDRFISRHRLSPCPSCLSHIKVQEDDWRRTLCPFCGAPFGATRPGPKPDLLQALHAVQQGTSGLVAASLLGLSLTACEADTGLLEPGQSDTGAQASNDPGPTDLGPAFDDASAADANLADVGWIDAADPVPGPEYGKPPIADAGFADAEEPPPIADYGLPPILDAGANDTAPTDGEDAPIGLLYGIPPIDAGGS